MFEVNFAIIGAQRAGSTALSDALANYNGVELPALELPAFEARFFSTSVLEELQKYFSKTPSIRGIKRPDYLSDPGAPRNLASTFPHTLVIAVLRDPIERFLSATYWYQYVKLIPPQPLNSVLAEVRALGSNSAQAAAGGNPYAALLENGRYQAHLGRWHSEFPSSQLWTFFHDDLRHLELKTAACGDILARLGVEQPSIRTSVTSTRQNSGVYDGGRLKFLSYRPTTFRWEDTDRFRYVRSRLRETPTRAVVSRAFHLVDQTLLSRRFTSKQPMPLAPGDLTYLEDFYGSDLATPGGIEIPSSWKFRYKI